MFGFLYRDGAYERQILFDEDFDLGDPPREVQSWAPCKVHLIAVYKFNEQNPVCVYQGKKGLRYDYSHNIWRTS